MDATSLRTLVASAADLRRWADETLTPYAVAMDAEQRFSRELALTLGRAGAIGALLPGDVGAAGLDPVDYGRLHEEVGRVCQNTRNFLACQDMVLHSLRRWGRGAENRARIDAVRTSAAIAAFCLTEPGVGSDAASVTTSLTKSGDGYVLTGSKTWISFGASADLFVVIARLDGALVACWVTRDTPGVEVESITGLLGLRGSDLGTVTFDDCVLPSDTVLGPVGGGLVFVASEALDIGRFSTACGAAGLSRAALEAMVEHARTRHQYGGPIGDHQLVQELITDAAVDTESAELLCDRAGRARRDRSSDYLRQTLLAKYAASRAAVATTRRAVQLHGASGNADNRSVARFMRDATVLEIIEGTSQLQQSLIGREILAARPGRAA